MPPGEGWASRTERGWLRSFGRWSRDLRRSLVQLETLGDAGVEARVEAGDSQALARLDALLGPLRTCRADFLAEVPSAPTARTEEAAALVESLCRHFASAAEQTLKGLRDDDAQATAAGRQAFGRVLTAHGLVSEAVPPGEGQPLPIVDRRAGRSRINPRYGQAAAKLAERLVEARCWTEADWRRLMREATLVNGTRFDPRATYGYSTLGSRRINLSPSVCRRLDRLTYAGARPRAYYERLFMSVSVGTLAHEAYHRAGVVNEATAECYAMQNLSETAQALGAPRRYADGLGRLAWRTYDLVPRAYRSRECRDGGKLDLEQASGASWP